MKMNTNLIIKHFLEMTTKIPKEGTEFLQKCLYLQRVIIQF